MTSSSVPIGTLCLDTILRDPTTRPDSPFRYVDLSSIDRSTKGIAQPAELLGRDAPSRARKEIRTNDVLVSTVRPNLNAVAIVPPELDGQIASTGFCVLRADALRLHPRFLFHRVRCEDFVRFLTARVTGANYPAVSDEIVRGAPIPVPPLAEQERIVRILDAAEELRRLREQADRRTADLIPALFHDMFGDPASNPKGWPLVPVSQAGAVQLGRQRAPKYQSGLHTRPYVRVANVFEDRIDVSDVLSMDFDERDFDTYHLQPGDILLNEGQSTELVGRPAMWLSEVADCCFQNTLIRFRAGERVTDPHYALFVFLAWFRSGVFARASSKTSNVAHLGAGRFAQLPFPLAPLPLQRAFAARAAEARTLATCQAETRPRLADLFQSLLHRAFQGEL